MASKPDDLPIWDETEERTEKPDTTRQQTGWVFSGSKFEKPAGQYFNWLFNNIYKWLKYLDEVLNINALTEKVTLNANDEFLIEDSEDSNIKKKAKLSSISSLISTDTRLNTADEKYVGQPSKIEILKEDGSFIKNQCSAFLSIDGTVSPPTINNQYNIASVTRPSTGTYIATFAKAMDNDNYIIVGSSIEDIGGTNVRVFQIVNKSTSSVTFKIVNKDSVESNVSEINFAVFGGMI